MDTTKQNVKALAKAIEAIEQANDEANYYNGLFDGGEWSQTDPSDQVKTLLERHGITPEQLETMHDMAVFYESLTYSLYPNGTGNPFMTPESKNIWYNIRCSLGSALYYVHHTENEHYIS